MSTTYQQLLRRYDRPCLPLADVMAEYLPHIQSVDHLMALIRSREISLRYTRLHSSRKAPPVVYLYDLAAWLDAQAPNNQPPTTPAANQAA